MPYLKNSLVKLLISSIFLIFSSISIADEGNFILPQKKITENNFSKVEKKKIKNEKLLIKKPLPKKKTS